MIPRFQVYDTRETCEPAARSRIRCCDGPDAMNRQNAGMVRRRGQRIRKRLLPRLEVICGLELDIGKKVFSGARDP